MSNEFNNDGREDNGYENYGFNNNANGSGNGQGSDPADYAFKTVLKNGRPKTMGWSVAALVLGIVSVVCCCFGWASLILGVLAIVFAVISRRSLGYFDGMSIAGLILGIFGIVFGVAAIIGAFLLPEDFIPQDFFQDYYGDPNSPNSGNL